jgi:hypothetical protein
VHKVLTGMRPNNMPNQSPSSKPGGYGPIFGLVGVSLPVIVIALFLHDRSTQKQSPINLPLTQEQCRHDFKAIRNGHWLTRQSSDSCAQHFSAFIKGIPVPDFAIRGASLRVNNTTLSLYGAVVEKIDHNPQGQLGDNHIPAVRISYGTKEEKALLEFGTKADADAAFSAISDAIAHLDRPSRNQ